MKQYVLTLQKTFIYNEVTTNYICVIVNCQLLKCAFVFRVFTFIRTVLLTYWRQIHYAYENFRHLIVNQFFLVNPRFNYSTWLFESNSAQQIPSSELMEVHTDYMLSQRGNGMRLDKLHEEFYKMYKDKLVGDVPKNIIASLVITAELQRSSSTSSPAISNDKHFSDRPLMLSNLFDLSKSPE